MVSSDADSVRVVKFEQATNAPYPIRVTPSGMVTSVSPEQPEKASSPIDVRALDRVILVTPDQQNTPLPIEVTVLGMTTSVIS